MRRTHGGAVSINQVALDAGNAARLVWKHAEKVTIAAAVAGMVVDGDTVLLDSGTTALEVARALVGRNSLTFISNGLDIVAELTRVEGQNLYSVGGEYFEANRSFAAR